MDAMPDASGKHDASADAGRTHDAGSPDSGQTRHACPNGSWVASPSGCEQDDAFCFPLADDAGWCTGLAAPQCPVGAEPIDATAPCPSGSSCWQFSEGLRCMTANDDDASVADDDASVAVHDAGAPIQLDSADGGKHVSVAVGQRVDVRLQDSGAPVHELSDPWLSSTAVKFVGRETESGSPFDWDTFHFRCIAKGTCVIAIDGLGHFEWTIECE
jgi:hypothetical protein